MTFLANSTLGEILIDIISVNARVVTQSGLCDPVGCFNFMYLKLHPLYMNTESNDNYTNEEL